MLIFENINYAPLSGSAGKGDLYLPETSGTIRFPVLLIHGGGWCAMDKRDVCGIAHFLCSELKIPVFNINYRLSTEAPWPACGDDCLSAANFLLNTSHSGFQGIDRRRIFVIGGSAGGHLALMTGLRLPPCRVAGIISISGIAAPESDFAWDTARYTQLFQHERVTREEMRSISPAFYLSKTSPAILCTHAKEDNVVPIQSTMDFLEATARHNLVAESFFYSKEENGYSHRIWIPNSVPHKLYPELEECIAGFIRRRVQS